jgi:hypothetical protein
MTSFKEPGLCGRWLGVVGLCVVNAFVASGFINLGMTDDRACAVVGFAFTIRGAHEGRIVRPGAGAT